MEEKTVSAAEREAQEQMKAAQAQAAAQQAAAQKMAEDQQKELKKKAVLGMIWGVLAGIGTKLIAKFMNNTKRP